MQKHLAIVAEIEASIRRGELSACNPLPTVSEMTKRYGISRTTVDQVFTELERRGLVSRKRGSGIYLKKTPASILDQTFDNVLLSGALSGISPDEFDIEVTDFIVAKPEAHASEQLCLHDRSFVFYVQRVCRHGKQVVNAQYINYPVEIFRDIRTESLREDMREWLIETYGVTPDSYHKAMRAVSASQEEADLFGIATGSPLFEVEQIGYLDNGRPFELVVSHFLPSVAEYHTIDSEPMPL